MVARTSTHEVTRSTGFKVGWWILTVVAALSLIGHASAPISFGGGEELLFIGFAAMNLYALVVLVIPYRRGELWAWYVTWAFVATYAFVVFYAAEVGPGYLGAAVVLALAQTLTWSSLRRTAG